MHAPADRYEMNGLKIPAVVTKYVAAAITILFFSVFQSPRTEAGEESIRASSVVKFTAGVITAFSIHEGSHALVAGLTGTDMDWEIGNYNQPIGFTEHANNNFKGFSINAAGLLSQAAAAEIILQVDKIDKNDAFVRGMMAWNIVNPMLYTLDYWFFRISNKEKGYAYQGDIQGIEHYCGEPCAHGFALSMVAIAAFQGYRFVKTQPWAPAWIKGKAHNLTIAPLTSGGIAMSYSYAF
jgi:hypothetical protein